MKRILVGLILCGSLLAQRSDTLFKKIFTNVTAASTRSSTTPNTSTYVPNIGQVGHQVVMLVHNNGANVCDPVTTFSAVEIDGSFDGTSWFPISPTNNVNNSAGLAQVAAQGLFPFISLLVTNGDIVNCAIDAWYSGTVSAVTSNPTLTGNGYGYPVAGVPVGINNNALIQEKGVRLAGFSQPATGSQAIINIVSSNTSFVVVDCVTFSIQATAALAAATTVSVSIFDVTTNNPLYGTSLSLPNGAAAGAIDRWTQCGINASGARGDQLSARFAAGVANVNESVALTYYKIAN